MISSSSTARDYGLVIGEGLFPSETVLLENPTESDENFERVRDLFDPPTEETAIPAMD